MLPLSTLLDEFRRIKRKCASIGFILNLAFAILILFVEVRERVANVFELNFWGDAAEVEGVNLDGANESWQRHLLEPVMDESSDGLCTGDAIRAAGESLPIDINRHD